MLSAVTWCDSESFRQKWHTLWAITVATEVRSSKHQKENSSCSECCAHWAWLSAVWPLHFKRSFPFHTRLRYFGPGQLNYRKNGVKRDYFQYWNKMTVTVSQPPPSTAMRRVKVDRVEQITTYRNIRRKVDNIEAQRIMYVFDQLQRRLLLLGKLVFELSYFDIFCFARRLQRSHCRPIRKVPSLMPSSPTTRCRRTSRSKWTSRRDARRNSRRVQITGPVPSLAS